MADNSTPEERTIYPRDRWRADDGKVLAFTGYIPGTYLKYPLDKPLCLISRQAKRNG